MSVEPLDIIYGAFIVLLHATAESGLIVFHSHLRLLFSYDRGDGTLKLHREGAG